MLSYRHAYHAGSPADVLKHSVLVHCIRHAQTKDTALAILDTHAGAASYDLTGPMAEKLGEWRQGILALLRAPEPVPELVAPFLELVRGANPDRRLEIYPGSAALAAALLRPQDRLDLNELHVTDHAVLVQSFALDRRVRVTREDGLPLLVSRLPPPERRGLALIDPSYELKTDYNDVVSAVARAYRRFATGMFILWYPVIDRARTTSLLEALVATGIRRQFRIELGMAPDSPGRGLTASGLVIVNPPWTLPAASEAALPWLAAQLGATGPIEAGWLAPE